MRGELPVPPFHDTGWSGITIFGSLGAFSFGRAKAFLHSGVWEDEMPSGVGIFTSLAYPKSFSRWLMQYQNSGCKVYYIPAELCAFTIQISAYSALIHRAKRDMPRLPSLPLPLVPRSLTTFIGFVGSPASWTFLGIS